MQLGADRNGGWPIPMSTARVITYYLTVRGLNLWIYYPPCVPKKHHWSPNTSALVTEISKFTDNYKPAYFNSSYSLVVLPFVKYIDKDSLPISFINLGIIDETTLVFDF